MRKTVFLVLTLVFVITFCGIPTITADSVTQKTNAYSYLNSGLTNMPKLTAEEIWQLLDENSTTMPSSDEIFDTTPSVTAPYTPGKVKNELLQRVADRLNALRTIAGLPVVALDDELCKNAQYGAVLLAASAFSHYPDKPGDMSDDFYEKGVRATSSSNIYAGLSLLSTPDGFMDDSDSSNIDRLGHRRWQLNPSMGKIGFGYVLGGSYGRYTTEKVFDQSGTGGDYSFIGWPASGAFPKELFGKHVAWSVTVNPSRYEMPEYNTVTVTLTHENDGKTWTFSSGSSDGYFNVNTGSYGISNCIIFRPDGIDTYQGNYTVVIEGLKNSSGKRVDFAYQVNFFSLTSAQPDSVVLEQFYDVPRDAYYAPAVAWTVKNDITEGTGEHDFSPELIVSRAQAITFLWRAAGNPEPTSMTSPFSDVTEQYSWEYKAVLWAAERGITNGNGDGKFGVDDMLSYDQMLTFMCRAAGGDTSGDWSTKALAWAKKNNLTDGLTFTAKADCPRSDVVYFLWRELE